MRIRKLATTQSVVFCVSEDIQIKILRSAARCDGKKSCVSDIMRWTMSETCSEIQKIIPLWAAQGIRSGRQTAIWNHSSTEVESQLSRTKAEMFLENDCHSLADRYHPNRLCGEVSTLPVVSDEHAATIQARCLKFEDFNSSFTILYEEQERELSSEVEEECQIEKPPAVEPPAHAIHPDLLSFVCTGDLVQDTTAYHSAFEVLHRMSAPDHFDLCQFRSGLLVSDDYAKTILPTGNFGNKDLYQRLAQFVITSPIAASQSIKHMIIISPFEAYRLLSGISKSPTVTLHLYAPRANQDYSALDKLDLHTFPGGGWKLAVPTHLRIQLNLFAGQLYFSSFEGYIELCNFLGLAWEAPKDGKIVSADGFILSYNGLHETGSYD